MRSVIFWRFQISGCNFASTKVFGVAALNWAYFERENLEESLLDETLGLGNSRDFLSGKVTYYVACQKSSFSAFAFTFLTFQTFQAFHEIFLNVNKPKAFSALGLFGTLVSIIHATFL